MMFDTKRYTTTNSVVLHANNYIFIIWKAYHSQLRSYGLKCGLQLTPVLQLTPEFWHVLIYSNEIWVLEQNNKQQQSVTIWL